MNAPRYLAIVGEVPPSIASGPRDGLSPAFSSERLHLWASPHVTPIGAHGAVVGHLFTRTCPSRRVTALTGSTLDRIVRSSGASLMEEYWGGYVAFLRTPDGDVRIVRDPSGAIPVFWSQTGGGIALAPEIGLPPFSRSEGLCVDADALALFLWSPHYAGRRTCIQNVSELLPGYALDVRKSGISETSLWSPWDHAPDPYARVVPDLECVRDTVIDCIRSWGDAFSAILLGMSGGLDSTIVGAALANSTATTHGLTMVSAGPTGDEREYASQAATAFGVALESADYRSDRIDITAPIVDHVPRPLLSHYAQAIAAVHDHVAQQRSIDAFFSGNGGDNVFCLMRSVTPIVDRLRAASSPAATFATFRDVARLTDADVFTIVRQVLRRLSAASRPTLAGDTSFLNSHTHAQALDSVDRHPWLDAPEKQLPGAVAHVAMLRRAHGNDGFHSRSTHPPSVAPLLSQPIVEMCLGIPSWSWIEGGVDRSIVRRAFRGVIPNGLLQRKSKGGPQGFVDRIFRQNEERILTLLREGVLRHRGIISDISDHSLATSMTGNNPFVPQRLLALVAAEAWARRWGSA